MLVLIYCVRNNKWNMRICICVFYSGDSHSTESHVGLKKNYCRNPDRDKHGPWCYTNPNNRLVWDYCKLKHCEWLNNLFSSNVFLCNCRYICGSAESRCGLVQDMPNIGTVQKVESSISSLIYLLLNSFICVRQLPLACATLLECILCASSEIKNSLRYITVGFEAMSAADLGLNLFALFLGGVPFKGLSGDVCGRFSD